MLFVYGRTVRFAVLGMSLSALLEISAAHDFLRGLLSLLSEFDTVTDENFKARTVSIISGHVLLYRCLLALKLARSATAQSV
jgi:hypothetical protein